ncbi:glycoside hydrolase family 43 protein [Luteolibacter pohnpeiensis]|uniref:Glycoside hydrolase family 43 protein n=1 Tax=Luteolibacter pohnpeiensis TaxID=454153 RepID=A0A934S667_9BACT|nr:glycoside hydrolase family 43 protein [Luteolibacter pohnpeiensis]MBK1881909.1 glycoside hydrolase family 43 protein [Luteolibacter pohnpeiensis]
MPHPFFKAARTLILAAAFLNACFVTAAEKPGTFHNPVNPSADPWMTWYDGYYYLSTTQGNCVRLWKAKSIVDLKDAEPVTVWEGGKGVWAAEFHQLESEGKKRWFCYFTKTDGPDEGHRMFVMQSKTSKITGPYDKPVKINTDPKDEFYAIDGTVMTMPDGTSYFLWAAHPGHIIRIAEMENPWTLKGDSVYLPASGFGCPEVREGPFAIHHGDRMFLTYSACDTGKPDYAVGVLWMKDDENPLLPDSWHQVKKPLLRREDKNEVFGPGHHSFFKSPDGKEDWIAYHAKTTSEYTYSGRSTRIQQLLWDRKGMPIPVVPESLDTAIKLPSGDPRARR